MFTELALLSYTSNEHAVEVTQPSSWPSVEFTSLFLLSPSGETGDMYGICAFGQIYLSSPTSMVHTYLRQDFESVTHTLLNKE